MPRSPIIATRSRKFSLKLKYQRTQGTTISWSKCRPLNGSSVGTNRTICLSSSVLCAFAPEPPDSRSVPQQYTPAHSFALGSGSARFGCPERYREQKRRTAHVSESSHSARPVDARVMRNRDARKWTDSTELKTARHLHPRHREDRRLARKRKVSSSNRKPCQDDRDLLKIRSVPPACGRLQSSTFACRRSPPGDHITQ
jgi:hypothetical protein